MYRFFLCAIDGQTGVLAVYRTFREEETIMKRIAMLAALALAVGIGGADSSAQPCSDSNTCATNGQANETEHALKTQQVPGDGRAR
jgi:hypothetical protein